MKSPIRPRTLPASIALAVLLGAGLARADVTPAALFADHAVLQRDKPVPVWGTADAGEKVSVTFAGHTESDTADASGHWRVTLPALPASTESRDLVIHGKNTVTCSDVLVGEVWLCSGQSNMERVMNLTYDAPIDIPGSANYPLIRHFKVAGKVSETPSDTTSGAWKLPGSDTTGAFTAVGYYFARDLLDLLHVPIGLINSTWGGTPVEAWTDPASYQADPAHASVQKRWDDILAAYPAAKAKYDRELTAWRDKQKIAKTEGHPFNVRAPRSPAGPGHQHSPMGLYNGMIAPLEPYAIRGAIWYQGEANASHPGEYHSLFSSMITGWRHAFGQGDFPFYWVQLANFASGDADATNWAFLREAQTQTLALPATGQAVIIDIGDVHNIHPRDKRDVGRRLARLALHRTYGLDFVDSGPVLDQATREGAGYRISFSHTDGGLIDPLNTVSGFELAGSDHVFHPATAEIRAGDNTVLVTSAEVAEPVAVRYAWRNAPVAGLFNAAGLPAVPFRTDDWPAD